MALNSCPAPVVIQESDLEGWKVIGSGGFGQVHKARHQKWCCDVAVKLLHYDDGKSSSLLREVDMMRQGSSPYVIHVHGVFKGRPPSACQSVQLGLVMEFMERGSLASLQELLKGPPPWPLVCRLIHHVALGINYLHNLSPAMLHLDLKPSNVLLDSSLNAKLTDFGLAQFHHSTSLGFKKDTKQEGGTTNYMPPEAFDVKAYNPSKASDIYSYGILLWSIVTGKRPYENALSNRVRFRIPRGDRPSLNEITCQEAGRAGLTGLIDLMQRCWEAKADKRPSAFVCAAQTEELYKMHKHTINDAVHQVLKKLEQKEEEEERIAEHFERISISQASGRTEPGNFHDNVPTGPPPIQEMAGRLIANKTSKAKIKDSFLGQLASACHVDQTWSSKNYKEKRSSVHPIQSPSPSHPAKTSLPGKAPKQPFREHLSSQYQRQFSSPDTFPCNPPPTRTVNMQLSNVTGFQNGNNNSMCIHITGSAERKRHPTAPSTIT